MSNEETPSVKKALPKGKLIAIVILAVVIVAAVIAGVLYMKWYNSPEQQYQRAFASGDSAQVDDVISKYSELRESATVADTLNTKLDELQRSFLAQTVDYSAAISELDRIQRQGVTGTMEKLAQVRSYVEALNASRTAFATAESFFSSENYAEAIQQYKKVIDTDPNSSNAAAKIETCYNKYRDKALAEAEALTVSGSYESAIGLLESALSVLPNDAKIQEKIILYQSKLSQMKISDALTNAKTFADAGDYANALRAIESHYKANPNDYQLSTRYAEYSKAYEDQVIAAADSLAETRRYDEAIDQIKIAQGMLPNSQILKDKIAALEASKPLAMANLTPVNGGWEWNEGTPIDPFGNNYSGASFSIHRHIDGQWNDGSATRYVEYRLYGNYNSISFAVAPHESIHENASFYVQVYTDDGSYNPVLVFTTPEIRRKSDQQTFDVPINGAEFVKICLVLGDESSAIFSELQAWPN